MRIGINALYLIPDRVGGSEIYLRRLLEGLAKIDPVNHYVIFTNRENRGSFPLAENFSEHNCPMRALFRPGRIFWEQAVLPRRVRKERLDLLHSPGFTAPLFLSCPSVVTVLDTIYLEFPETFPPGARRAMRLLARLSASRARRVIALSRHSRDRILRVMRVRPEAVEVVYLASGLPDSGQPSEEKTKGVLHRYGIRYPYILTVSAAHPHKNLLRLVEAYYQARREGVGHCLVMMGVKHPRYFQRLRETVRRLGLEAEVVFTGWVSEDDKSVIYSAADLLVYPSLLEGFGLPVVEAMARGVPVACSGVPSLAEAAGSAARFFDPHSVEEMSAAIGEVLGDPRLRAELAAAGRAHAAGFSWEETARRTLAVYRSAASGGAENRTRLERG